MLNKTNRRETLIAHGVPAAFLDVVDDPQGFLNPLIALKPNAFYFYMGDDIYQSYAFLKDCVITPVFESANHDNFWVLLQQKNSHRFIHYELESVEPIQDFGQNFMAVLVNLLIDYYEMADDLNISELTKYGKAIGFDKSEDLFVALEEATEQGLRRTFELDKEWREKKIPTFS